MHGTITASIDQRPYQTVLKHYEVEGIQTFVPIHPNEREPLAKQAMDELIKKYSKYDHVIEKREAWIPNENKTSRFLQKRMKGDTLALVYDHPDFGPQAVRAQILVGYNSRFTQIADVSPNALESAKVTNFLNSIKTRDQVIKTNTPITDQWKNYTSPTGLFSVYLPPKKSPHFPEDPHIKQTKNSEIIRGIFRDPIRDEHVVYSNYGFINTKNFTFKQVEKIINEEFIKRHGREPSRVELTKKIINEKPLIYTEYAVLPTEQYPEQNFTVLHVYFIGKKLFVQEIMGPKRLIRSTLIQNAMALHTFEP